MEEAIKKRRVLLVDDHPIVRRGLAEVIQRTTDLEVVGEVSDAEGALRAIDTLQPDIVIADITLPTMNGIDMTRLMHDRHPGIPVLMVSMHEESLYAERALRAGAKGYITKLEPPDSMLKAIRQVLSGRLHVNGRTAARLSATAESEQKVKQTYSRTIARMPSLTNRELEVFEYIGMGLTTREIAERLKRSTKTVEAHRNNIVGKLGLSGSATLREVATMWIANGRRVNQSEDGNGTAPAAVQEGQAGQAGSAAPAPLPPDQEIDA
jgi:DNA-binding NarL/FixJ family response regulator